MIGEGLARLLATSSLAGTRASLTLFILALVGRLGVIDAPQDWMTSNVGLAVLLSLVVLEELAEQDEDLQALVDVAAYALRAGAGALAASTIQSSASAIGVEDLPTWAAALTGAGVAAGTHHLRAKLHEQLEGAGDSVLSPRTWLAWLEAGGVLGLMIAVIFAPAIALGFVVAAAVASVAAVLIKRAAENRLRRRDCPHCRHRVRVEASRCPGCRGPVEIVQWLSS